MAVRRAALLAGVVLSSLILCAQGGPVGLPTVPTLAALKAIPTTQFSYVERLGYTTPFDGGGTRYHASPDPCSIGTGAGDNGSQVLSSNGKCWIADSPTFGTDVRVWGVKFDNSTDNSAALQSAFNWFALGNKLTMPASALSANFASPISVTLSNQIVSPAIEGAGSDTTTIKYTGSTGTAITVTYTSLLNSSHWKGFSLVSSQAGLASGITLTQTATKGTANFQQTDFDQISIFGSDGPFATNYFAAGLTLSAVDNVNLNRVLIYGSAARLGAGITTGAANPAYVLNISNSIISGFQWGFIYGNKLQGVTVSQSNFGSLIGIYIPAASTEVAQLSIVNSQFTTSTVSIYSAACMYQLYVGFNEILTEGGSTGIQIDNDCGSIIVGNTLSPVAPRTTQTGIIITGTQANTPFSTITDNQFFLLNLGFTLGATTTGIHVHDNTYNLNNTNFTNSGVGNIIGTPSFVVASSATGGLAAATTFYCGIGCSTTEAVAEFTVPEDSIIDHLAVILSGPPGGAVTNTYRVRCVGAATAVTVSITGGVGFAQDITHYHYVPAASLCDVEAIIGAGAANNSMQATLRISRNY